jgi:hypothetical protein
MQSNIDTWLRQKSKTEENYLKNLDIIHKTRLQLKYNSYDNITVPVGYIFDTEGNLKKISAEKSRSPKRSSRSSEDEQYMDDLIDNFQ